MEEKDVIRQRILPVVPGVATRPFRIIVFNFIIDQSAVEFAIRLNQKIIDTTVNGHP